MKRLVIVKYKFIINHKEKTMKNLLFMLSVFFAFCSCAKDYSQLLNKRVNQYRKEGKWLGCNV